MARHAYLLMVHQNHPVIETCLRMIDDERNDVFVACDPEEEEYYRSLQLKYSSLKVVPHSKPIVWSGTLWEIELGLIKAAVAKGGYSYLHLLSESCLPIKTQDQIHEFFDNDANRLIYMHVNCHTFKSIQDRCKTKYPFADKRFYRKHKWIKALALAMVKIKIAFGVNRLRNNKEIPVIWNGWNWFSIPMDFAQYAVEKENLLYHTFDHSLAADEVFLQSLAMNSSFKDRMYGFNGRDDAQDASKRMIRWDKKRWTPLVFREEDFPEILQNENCFFARKFYAVVDMRIVELVEKQFGRPDRP